MSLDHDGVAELLGAYALDAVDPDEATAIEAHVEGCDECRAELEEHRTVVGWIAGNDESSRQRVWAQIAAATAVAHVAHLPDPVVVRPPRGIRFTAIAAVAVLVFATMALVDANHRRERRSADAELALTRTALEVFAEADVKRVQLRSDDGRITLQAAIRPDGTGVVVADALPTLAQDRTYQLWMITEGGPVSTGLLGTRPGIEHLALGDSKASALAVTKERAGGADTPTLPVIASGALPPS